MALYLHDATYAYLSILNDSMMQGKGHPDGRTVQRLVRNQSFEGWYIRKLELVHLLSSNTSALK